MSRGVAMCEGGWLLADFTAGGTTRPEVPDTVAGAIVPTTDGRWVVWAHKVARPLNGGFYPLNTQGAWYPPVAVAHCWRDETHEAPAPGCTCGFHAVALTGRPPASLVRGFRLLDVALSGRVLAFAWRDGVLFRAAEQAVIRVAGEDSRLVARRRYRRPTDDTPKPPVPPGGAAGRPRRDTDVSGDDAPVPVPVPVRRGPGWSGDGSGDRVARRPRAPHGSGPIRLALPPGPPQGVTVDDDAGLCVVAPPGPSVPHDRAAPFDPSTTRHPVAC